MRHACCLLLALTTGLAVTACDGGTAAVDAATADAATLPMSRLGGACFVDSQCPGVGATCRPAATSGYPGGQCTAPCIDRTECDDGAVYNACVTLPGASATTCESFCRNGHDCSRPGYTCAAEGYCFPVCSTNEECGAGADCDPYTGRCVATGTVPTTGALTGEACASDAACRSGTCRQAQEGAYITGFVGGYCQSNCRLPSGYNTSTFFDGTTLPAGTCPGTGVVCFPTATYAEGDLGVCLAECHADSDCRTGYQCVNNFTGTPLANGVCRPMNCATGGTCPAGTTCHQYVTSSGNTAGLCG